MEMLQRLHQIAFVKCINYFLEDSNRCMQWCARANLNPSVFAKILVHEILEVFLHGAIFLIDRQMNMLEHIKHTHSIGVCLFCCHWNSPCQIQHSIKSC